MNRPQDLKVLNGDDHSIAVTKFTYMGDTDSLHIQVEYTWTSRPAASSGTGTCDCYVDLERKSATAMNKWTSDAIPGKETTSGTETFKFDM